MFLFFYLKETAQYSAEMYGDYGDYGEENNSSYTEGDYVDFNDADGGEDMVLLKGQHEFLFGKGNDSIISSFAGSRQSMKPWPKGRIPYELDPSAFPDKEESRAVRAAMDVWEDVGCMSFVPRQQSDQHGLFIHDAGNGCWSLLGFVASRFQQYPQGKQPLSLKNPGCRNFGTYLHELGHALGLAHEHQMPARDRFIHYYETNIDPAKLSQLEKYNDRVAKLFQVPYDLSSIMHYDVTSFSIDHVQPTLGVDNPWLKRHIGRRFSRILSFGDAKTINILYRCAAQCNKQEKMACFNRNGYMNKKCECMTSDMYMDEYCRDDVGYEDFCSGLAPIGKCNEENPEHQLRCSKSCGFCPIFLPGNSAIGQIQRTKARRCVDHYAYPENCKKWSRHCNTAWMRRYCRGTCKKCQDKIGDCPNEDNDEMCDRYARAKMCSPPKKGGMMQDNSRYIRTKCGDSCDSCNYRKPDMRCRNKDSDEECNQKMHRGECESKPRIMFDRCPSTCARCYWNAGSCSNQIDDEQCIKLALQNWCTHNAPNNPNNLHQKAINMCGKTCDTCKPNGK